VSTIKKKALISVIEHTIKTLLIVMKNLFILVINFSNNFEKFIIFHPIRE